MGQDCYSSNRWIARNDQEGTSSRRSRQVKAKTCRKSVSFADPLCTVLGEEVVSIADDSFLLQRGVVPSKFECQSIWVVDPMLLEFQCSFIALGAHNLLRQPNTVNTHQVSATLDENRELTAPNQQDGPILDHAAVMDPNSEESPDIPTTTTSTTTHQTTEVLALDEFFSMISKPVPPLIFCTPSVLSTEPATPNNHIHERDSAALASQSQPIDTNRRVPDLLKSTKKTPGRSTTQLAQDLLAKKLGEATPDSSQDKEVLFDFYAQHLDRPLTKEKMEALTVLIEVGCAKKKKNGLR
jgi:hypothetical protein